MKYVFYCLLFACVYSCSPEEKPLQPPPPIDSVDLIPPPDSDLDTTGGILEMPEVMPEFQGGESGLMRFLSTEIHYPTIEKEKGVSGTVYVRFVVEKDGSVTGANILRGVPGHESFSKEVLRVIAKMPKWKPGTNNGSPARTVLNLPVKFALD